MLFNTLQFAVFFAIVFSLYVMLKHKWQNRLLLVASYIFYGAWDVRFLSLIFISTLVDYFCGLKIHESDDQKKRKIFVAFSVLANLGLLFFFKYFNFFTGSLDRLLDAFGIHAQPFYLNIILPMGISFYTFQSMSYTIDIYRKEMKPTRKFLDFALFVAFFPQLVAGPIERAKRLLPQILAPRKLSSNNFYEGCFLIFWGIFLKVFIADNLANLVDPIFNLSPPYNGMIILCAMYAFMFQIYCDFAGYSHVARGLGKVMGFEIMINFNLPFFVTNIQDYWNKWHISLSSWIRDYLYIPLFRFMRKVKGNTRLYLALIISMTLIGLWHGAAWNYVLFGVYYGLLLVAYVIIRMRCSSWIKPKSTFGQQVWLWARIVFMFHLVVIGMLLFRVQYGSQIYFMLKGLFFNFQYHSYAPIMLGKIIFYTWILVAVQFAQFLKKDLMFMYKAHPVLKTAFYVICFFLLILQGAYGGNEFIYFQF